MLLIDGSIGLASPFYSEVAAVCPKVQILAFWEQITGIEVGQNHAYLFVDYRAVGPSEEIIIIRPPRFARVLDDSAEADFRWAECNAALNAFLLRRRRNVPNGRALIPNAHLADNPDAHRKTFASALRADHSTADVTLGGQLWILATKGWYSTFPFRCSLDLSFDLQASLYSALESCGLDYAILEVAIQGDRTSLQRVHLVPPPYGPSEIQRSLAQFFRGWI